MKINSFVPDSTIFDKINSDSKVTNNDTSNSFFDMLKSKLDEVNNQQIDAENTTQAFIEGDNTDIHNVMLSTEEAKMSLELAVQVRNKIVDAYQELNRMQL
ncbi:flagellar hook-basal body complex protein FliE [Candidatus Clostridium stratigraminis]|uniref:Flagellar hook-basal body complex protein FliE n=1 Tax=Candidatus Clostridium stratigraminis TaxID=3381661 RepID=A0ABW8T394_9CLOT